MEERLETGESFYRESHLLSICSHQRPPWQACDPQASLWKGTLPPISDLKSFFWFWLKLSRSPKKKWTPYRIIFYWYIIPHHCCYWQDLSSHMGHWLQIYPSLQDCPQRWPANNMITRKTLESIITYFKPQNFCPVWAARGRHVAHDSWFSHSVEYISLV